jgi:RES domain-containing protein
MFVYRIVKNSRRTDDLSGMGAFHQGGRWNSPGTYMLYSSENSSLAFLESLVYFDQEEMPEKLHVIFIKIAEEAPIYILPYHHYPSNWMEPESLESKLIGDKLMEGKKYLAIKVKSRVNPYEFNYLLNPLFPRYHDMVKITSVNELAIDKRLI